MVANLPIIVLGFLLGMRHAMDPDHVIAVATIVSRQKTAWGAALIGTLRGIGHTISIILVGGAIILFGVVIPPRIGLAMEFAVAVMLILLGTLTLTGMMQRISAMVAPGQGPEAGVHVHPHRHGDYVHSHGHRPESHGHPEGAAPVSRLDRVFGRLGVYHAICPLIVGLVHGLAGSAAVALLVLTTIRDPVWGVAYLLLFGLGTIAGMMVVTAAIGLPFAYTATRSLRFHRSLGMASGLLSQSHGFGLFLVYQIGFVDGLFSSAPRWTPQ